MILSKFEDLSKSLKKFINKSSKDNIKGIEKSRNNISEIAGYLIASEKKNFPQYFTSFVD